jgi:hypothetical protein
LQDYQTFVEQQLQAAFHPAETAGLWRSLNIFDPPANKNKFEYFEIDHCNKDLRLAILNKGTPLKHASLNQDQITSTANTSHNRK